MSATSLSRARSLTAALALAVATGGVASTALVAPPLPPAVGVLMPLALAQGGGELRWWGLSIYHGYLWTTGGRFSFDTAFALDLHYERSLTGRGIAERSVEEMARHDANARADLARWGEAMARLFPDVAKGDRLTGVHVPGQGARFFHNGRALGSIDDARFSRAFFGIWLDARTSQPGLRAQLLGSQ